MIVIAILQVAPPPVNGHYRPRSTSSGSGKFWLVHRGGYSTCELMPNTTLSDTVRCKVRLEQGGHILEVDENDLEKVSGHVSGFPTVHYFGISSQ